VCRVSVSIKGYCYCGGLLFVCRVSLSIKVQFLGRGLVVWRLRYKYQFFACSKATFI
jgi:hypothetical protein